MSSDRRRKCEAPASSGPRGGAGSGGGGDSSGAQPGWRYTLRVPSWSQAQLPDGETAVFYQVEVNVMPPQGEPRKRSVGRRFSSFVTLYKRLREELGAAAMRGLDPPPRRSLTAVNRKPELTEQRRWELEQWLWRLTESPEVANSVMMRHFCELDAASRVKPRPSTAAAVSAPGSAERCSSTSQLANSPASSLGAGAAAAAAAAAAAGFPGPSSSTLSHAPSWSGSEASDLLFAGESSSSSLVFAEWGCGGGALSAPAGDSPARSHSQPRHQVPPRQPSAAAAGGSDSQSDRSGRQESLLPATSGALAGAAAVGSGRGSGQLRLALPVQQRGAAKTAVRMLRGQLATIHTDLQDAAKTIAADQQAIAQLAAELAALKEQQQDTSSSSSTGGGNAAAAAAAAAQQEHAAAVEALKQQLAAVEAERDACLNETQQQQNGAASQDQQHKKQLAAVQAERDGLLLLQQEQQQRLAAVQADLAALQQQRQQEDAVRQEAAGRVEAERQGLQEQLQQAQAATAAAVADKEAAAASSRQDLKLLAKEVSRLRKQLAAAPQLPPAEEPQLEQAAAPAAAAAAAELACLRQQLAAAQAAAVEAQEAAAAAAATAAAAQQQTLEHQHQPQQHAASLMQAAETLRKLLASSGVKGSEGGLQAPGGMASRLAAADQQLASFKLQVQQQLLAGPAEEGHEGAAASSGGGSQQQLRQLLAGLLLDAAAAKQQQQALLRSTLAVTAQLQGLEERVLSPTASPVRRASLPPPL